MLSPPMRALAESLMLFDEPVKFTLLCIFVILFIIIGPSSSHAIALEFVGDPSLAIDFSPSAEVGRDGADDDDVVWLVRERLWVDVASLLLLFVTGS